MCGDVRRERCGTATFLRESEIAKGLGDFQCPLAKVLRHGQRLIGEAAVQACNEGYPVIQCERWCYAVASGAGDAIQAKKR